MTTLSFPLRGLYFLKTNFAHKDFQKKKNQKTVDMAIPRHI